jgi:hypothetical protein
VSTLALLLFNKEQRNTHVIDEDEKSIFECPYVRADHTCLEYHPSASSTNDDRHKLWGLQRCAHVLPFALRETPTICCKFLSSLWPWSWCRSCEGHGCNQIFKTGFGYWTVSVNWTTHHSRLHSAHTPATLLLPVGREPVRNHRY